MTSTGVEQKKPEDDYLPLLRGGNDSVNQSSPPRQRKPSTAGFLNSRRAKVILLAIALLCVLALVLGLSIGLSRRGGTNANGTHGSDPNAPASDSECVLPESLLFSSWSLQDAAAGKVQLLYLTSWKPAYLHYNADGKGWTQVPGVAMAPSPLGGFDSSKYQFLEIRANRVEFVPNNGAGTWDNGRSGNYIIDKPGRWKLENKVLSFIQDLPLDCPSTGCNSGYCNDTTKLCVCDKDSYSYDCSKKCPGYPSAICGGKGKCNDGAFGDGSCTCCIGFSTCDTKSPCAVRTDSDPENCGRCGAKCEKTDGMSSAVCSAGKCSITCASGYVLCDGACYKGSKCAKPPLPGCDTFKDNICVGDNIVTPDSFENRRWQTPVPGSSDYLPSYQSYYTLVGHARVKYSSDHRSAVVTIVTLSKNPSASLTYFFDGVGQSSNSKSFAAGGAYSLDGKLTVEIRVESSDGAKLVLPEVDFMWDTHTQINQPSGDYRNGQKGALAELFGWTHKDVEAECETLGKMGYLGAKLFPVMEQLMSTQPLNNELNPWYFMYQPVSYRLDGRMGSRADLRSLIATCRRFNVRVYADAVINHMVGNGNDANKHHRYNCNTWPNKTSSLDYISGSSGPSPFYTQGNSYMYNPNTDMPSSQEFPAVPYGPTDFHCERALASWSDPLNLNAGWLVGLTDLNTEKESVQQRIADYMSDLISIGFSGFRIDAAKHIHPDDLVGILSKFKDNMGGNLPADWFTWLEVLLGGEKDLLVCNENSGYNYGKYLVNKLSAKGFSQSDVDKVKLWYTGYPAETDADCGQISRWREVIQNDDHDQQNPGSSSRDMHDKGSVLVKDLDIPKHRGFEVKLFESPFGVGDNSNEWPIRTILSSYYFKDGAMAIPDGKSDCSLCKVTCDGCRSVPFAAAHDPNACGYEGPKYTRVHRDKAIVLAMRRWMGLSTSVSNKDLGLPDRCT